MSAWLTALVVAALGLMLWQLHENTLAETRHSLTTLGTAIAEQATRATQADDLVLVDLRRLIANEDIRTVAEFKTKLGREDIYRFLKDRSDFLPQVDAFTIIAADGKLVNFSRQWPIPPTDLSDRDYLSYFRTHDEQGIFVSNPVQNRGNGGWTVYVVRRIDGPDGTFLGMVLAAVDLDYFKDFFKTVSRNANTTVTLLRTDGIILASYPETAKIGDMLPSKSPWHHLVDTGPGVFETEGVLAAGYRMVSVHPLSNYPLVVNVSVAKHDALANWQEISLVTGLCAALAMSCVLLLIREQLRQLHSLESSETLLASHNTALEGTQRRLEAQTSELIAGRAIMAEQSTTLEAALSHMNQGILVVTAAGVVAVCNGRAAELLELPEALVQARPSFGSLIAYQRSHGEFAGDPATPAALGFEEAAQASGEYEYERPNGLILQVHTEPIRGGGLVRTYTDITDRRRSERQVQYLASHDALTGLLNRSGFQDQFEKLIAEAGRRRLQLAVFYVDLDGFKLVNDDHGHAIGDELLMAIASRLRIAVRDTDLAERLLTAVAETFRLGDVQVMASLSIGVALYPEDGTSMSELLQSADKALYRAKLAGKRTFCIFDPAIDLGPQAPLVLEHDLGQALANQELSLEYQPIVTADTLEVVRVEALIRWTHPTRGRVSPIELINTAERCGLIIPIGLWVLETACAAAQSWPWPLEVSVNLSPVQFARSDLVSQISHILQRTGLKPARLTLEITEGVLLENTARVRHTIANLRQIGIKFSLDDFGTAHAGLTYLRSFHFDVLKIDKSFVQDAARSAEAYGILGAIRAIGAACNLQVVAEGVETEEQLAIVRELRCDLVQGYLTGRPSPLVTIEQTGEAQPAPLAPHLRLVKPS